MSDENKTSVLVVGAAIIIGILFGVLQTQKISGEIKMISADIKETSSGIKDLETSIKEVDSTLKEVKASLSENDTVFRRDMQENGRRMLSIDYAAKFAKWDAAKMEIDELYKTIENAANLRHDLARTIQDFRSIYIPELRDAADTKDIKNFGAVWSDTYNACVACHKGSAAQP